MDKPSRFDRRLLIWGYLAIAASLLATIGFLAIAGAPPPQTVASVTVPVEIIASKAQDDTPASDALPAPPKGPPNGMQSARPFNGDDKRPRIAVLITELGPSRGTADAAIQHLPPDVSLAFLPFPGDVEDMVNSARVAGHEVLLDVPMEPAGYPDNDPGPDALMTTASDSENLRRLNHNLGRAHGYVGIVNFMGSRFTTAQEKLTPIFSALHQRDLLVADTRANALTAVPSLAKELKIPYAVADLVIDAQASRDSIDAALAQLEIIARANGKAFGVAEPIQSVSSALRNGRGRWRPRASCWPPCRLSLRCRRTEHGFRKG